MSRALRSWVRYAHAQVKSTTKRFRKPIRKKMWTPSQASQATRPGEPQPAEARPPPRLRPIVASEPLSR